MSIFSGLFSALGGGPTFKASGSGPGYQGPVARGINWPLISLMLGQTGAAISPRGSWQQNLGNTAARWARSNIYANAASKVQPNWNDYIKAIMGGPITPPGTPGPTSVAMNDKGELEVKMTPTRAPNTQVVQTPTPQTTYNNSGVDSIIPFLAAPLG